MLLNVNDMKEQLREQYEEGYITYEEFCDKRQALGEEDFIGEDEYEESLRVLADCQ